MRKRVGKCQKISTRITIGHTFTSLGDKALKIQKLHKGVGIAVSGFGGLSDSCVIAARSILTAQNKVSVNELKSCC